MRTNKFFCIVSSGRSGSHLLQSLLKSHPHINCNVEIFNSQQLFHGRRWLRLSGNYSYLVHAKAVWKFLRKVAPQILMDLIVKRRFLPKGAPERKPTSGFLMLYRDFENYPEVMPWIKRRGIKIIHLIRENQLKSLASMQAAMKRDVWHATKPVVWEPIELDPQKILQDLRDRYQTINDFRVQCAELPYLELTYESLVSHREQELAKVLDFLGEENYPLVTKRVKVSPDALDHLIKNYAEISAVLKDTEFSALLK